MIRGWGQQCPEGWLEDGRENKWAWAKSHFVFTLLNFLWINSTSSENKSHLDRERKVGGVSEGKQSLCRVYCQQPRSGLLYSHSVPFRSVQSLSRVRLFATPWIAARQASLSITNSRNLLKLMSIESVMPCSHLMLCRPLLLLPPIPPSIRVFSSESTLRIKWLKY